MNTVPITRGEWERGKTDVQLKKKRQPYEFATTRQMCLISFVEDNKRINVRTLLNLIDDKMYVCTSKTAVRRKRRTEGKLIQPKFETTEDSLYEVITLQQDRLKSDPETLDIAKHMHDGM